MTSSPNLDQLTPDQLRALAAQLLTQVDVMGKKIHRDQTVIENLTHEIAILKRHKFAKRSEQLSPDQGRLLDDLLDTDIVAIEAELKAVNPPAAPADARQQPKRTPLPPQRKRTGITRCQRIPSCAAAARPERWPSASAVVSAHP
ncbi:Transposase C of IS166 homeodomain protein [compost metagenome]